jgi:hypothetical protein
MPYQQAAKPSGVGGSATEAVAGMSGLVATRLERRYFRGVLAGCDLLGEIASVLPQRAAPVTSRACTLRQTEVVDVPEPDIDVPDKPRVRVALQRVRLAAFRCAGDWSLQAATRRRYSSSALFSQAHHGRVAGRRASYLVAHAERSGEGRARQATAEMR